MSVMDGRYLRHLKVSGAGYSAQLQNVTDTVTFSLALDKVTSMSIGLIDDYHLSLFNSRVLDKGTSLTYGEWRMVVDSVELNASTAGPRLDINALSVYVSAWQKQHGAKTWANADISQWFTDRCRDVGMKAAVQPGLGRKTIVREANLESGFQDTWEVMGQLKRELGLIMFERGQTLVVARPTWLMKQPGIIGEWPLWWDHWYNYSPAITGLPTYKGRNERPQDESLTFDLVSADAERIRPGDKVPLRGRFLGDMAGTWMVSDVGFPMTNGKPVSVTCIRPVDPAKEANPGTGAAAAAAWTGAPTSTGGRTQISLSNLPNTVAGYSGQQIVNAAHIIRAAQALGLSKRAMQIGVMTAMGESTLRVLNYGDAAGPDSRGLFQQRSIGWGTYQCRMDPYCSATSFFKALAKVAGWDTLAPTLAAHYTQRNADPNHYTRYWGAAVAVVDAVLSTATAAGGIVTGGQVPAGLSAAVDQYTTRVRGSRIDYDGASGAQCVDLTAHYTIALGGPIIRGHGRDWYRAGSATGFYTRIDRTQTARKGDIACWGSAMGGGYGHTAIVIQDQGPTLRVLSQNPGPAHIMTLTKNGLDGYLRPKSWK